MIYPFHFLSRHPPSPPSTPLLTPVLTPPSQTPSRHPLHAPPLSPPPCTPFLTPPPHTPFTNTLHTPPLHASPSTPPVHTPLQVSCFLVRCFEYLVNDTKSLEGCSNNTALTLQIPSRYLRCTCISFRLHFS